MTENSSLFCAKPRVPSIGSMIQRRFPSWFRVASVGVFSSATKASPGNRAESAWRINSCESKSACVVIFTLASGMAVNVA